MKKYLKLFTSFALVAAIAVGFTLAFLQADLGTKTNTFTSSKNVAGELTEPGWTDDFGDNGTWEDYLPNEAHAKDPMITINEGSEAAYVAIKVDFKGNDNTNINYETFKTTYANILTGNNVGFNATDWTDETVAFANAGGSNNSMFFVYKTTVQNETTNPLFDSVKVNHDIVKVNGKLPSFKIDVAGYAVQGTEITTSEALTALINMAK